MIDDKTEHYQLPLPNLNNTLKVDVVRLKDALTLIDQLLKQNDDLAGAVDGLATLDAQGHVPLTQLSQSDRVAEMSNLWNDMTGVVLDYALATPPSPAWRLCYGQAILADDAPAANLRQKLIADGFPYGQDGSGNPKIPDVRGRVVAGKDNMGGSAASRLTTAGAGFDGMLLGAYGGNQFTQSHSHTFSATSASSGAHTHTFSDTTSSAGAHTHSLPSVWSNSGGTSSNINYFGSGAVQINTATGSAGAHTHTVSGTTSSSGAHTHTVSGTSDVTGSGDAQNVQPTIVMNKIIKL